MAKENKAFEFGPFRLEVRERRLTRDGYLVPLRGRVFDTLHVLVSRHGCLVTKDELMAAVWPDSVVEETNLNHNICILRRALGEKATGQRYIETVPRQGYRFVADVKELDDLDESEFPRAWGVPANLQDVRELLPDETSSSVDSQPRSAVRGGKTKLPPATRTHWYQRQGIISSLTVAVLLIAGYFGVDQLGSVRRPSNSRIRLAVLPFENLTGDSSQKYVVDGFSHEIISQLGRWNTARVGVIARTSTNVYQGMRKSVGEIGRELGVDYIVEGSVRGDENNYRITVMLIRVDDQTHLWAANYNRTVDNITALQVEVARLVISEIGRMIEVEPDENSNTGYPQSLDTRSHDSQSLDALAGPEDKPPVRARLLMDGG
jgi:TolB-like protein/DNA-binding winged helix-turn-helix (wHTH) protein